MTTSGRHGPGWYFSRMPPHPPTVPFVPVVIGGELATYTLARAFHGELGVRTTVMTRGVPAPVRGSAIIDVGQAVLYGAAVNVHQSHDVVVEHNLLSRGPRNMMMVFGVQFL